MTQYAVGSDMRLEKLPEIAANWWKCITLRTALICGPLMELEKRLGQRDLM